MVACKALMRIFNPPWDCRVSDTQHLSAKRSLVLDFSKLVSTMGSTESDLNTDVVWGALWKIKALWRKGRTPLELQLVIFGSTRLFIFTFPTQSFRMWFICQLDVMITDVLVLWSFVFESILPVAVWNSDKILLTSNDINLPIRS